MEKITKILRSLHRSPIISVAVLVGFLCIQFHSFSHIDLNSLPSKERTHHTENRTTSQITDSSSCNTDAPVECASCVLTNHLQATANEQVHLFIAHAVGIVATGTERPVFESPHRLFQLRAPPFPAV